MITYDPIGHIWRLTTEDGSQYDGQWCKGRKHGQGIYISPTNLKYEGAWLQMGQLPETGRGCSTCGNGFDRAQKATLKQHFFFGGGCPDPFE